MMKKFVLLSLICFAFHLAQAQVKEDPVGDDVTSTTLLVDTADGAAVLITYTLRNEELLQLMGNMFGADTTVYLPCNGKFDTTRLTPPPYGKDTFEVLDFALKPCVVDDLKKGMALQGACVKAKLHQDSVLGRNSCNNISKKGGYPIAYCVRAEDNPRSIVYVDIDPEGASNLDSLLMNFFLPLENVNDNQPPSNVKDPNNIQEVVVRVYEDGVLKKTLVTPVLSKHVRDTAFWVPFFIDLPMVKGKKYQIQLYGNKPIYPNRSLSLMDFFGFRLVTSCKVIGKSCTWTGPRTILELDDECQPASLLLWESTCQDSFLVYVVKIDTVRPVITRCQRDTMIELPKGICEFDFNVLPIAYVDNCTQTHVEVFSKYGNLRTNGGLLTGIRPGKHTIVYVVTDACGNSTSCSFELRVKEKKGFSLICSQGKVVVLSDSCTTIPAKTFKPITQGLCCDSTIIIVQRMDRVSTGKDVEFCCGDVGQRVMVRVIVKSYCDPLDSNECMIEVEVQDKRPPRIECEPDLAVDCSIFDTTILDTIGRPTIKEECGFTLREDRMININACKSGTIMRTWTATDASGNTATCKQTIYIINPSRFSESDITWPKDDTLIGCTWNTDPSLTGRPRWVEPGCYNDIVVYVPNDRRIMFPNPKFGICAIIERTWLVSDNCQPGPGYRHVQRIVLKDTTLPVIVYCPADTTIGNFGACSSLVNVKLPPVLAKDCHGILHITNNGQYSTNKGADASGKYPIGTHHITYVVTDSCGNTATCKTTVTVVDRKPPTPYCSNGIITTVGNMGAMGIMVGVWAKDLNKGSYDDCCHDSTLTFSFSGDSLVMGRVFTCADVGENEVQMWVIDCHGNKSFCTTKVIIQDNRGWCPPGDTMNIGGTLRSLSGKPLEEVTVALNARDTLVTSTYLYTQLMKGTYTIRPSKQGDPLDGVSTADIVKIQRHILGNEPFSPYQLLAGDVNCSGSITAADIAEIRKLILGVSTDFSCHSSWMFVPTAYIFPDPSNPWNCPQEIKIQPLVVSRLNEHFIGIKRGDVNGSSTGAFSGDDRQLMKRSNDFDLQFIDSLYQKALAYELSRTVLTAVPNPTNDYVHITLPQVVPQALFIHLESGGKVPNCLSYEVHDDVLRVDMRLYPPGVYTLVIKTQTWRYVARVVKM